MICQQCLLIFMMSPNKKSIILDIARELCKCTLRCQKETQWWRPWWINTLDLGQWLTLFIKLPRLWLFSTNRTWLTGITWGIFMSLCRAWTGSKQMLEFCSVQISPKFVPTWWSISWMLTLQLIITIAMMFWPVMTPQEPVSWIWVIGSKSRIEESFKHTIMGLKNKILNTMDPRLLLFGSFLKSENLWDCLREILMNWQT